MIIEDNVFHKRVTNPHELFLTSLLTVKKFSDEFVVNKEQYRHQMFNKIISLTSIIEEGSSVGNNCFIGPNTQIMKNSKINNSIILGQSIIGKHSRLSNCYLAKGINISDNIVLKNVTITQNMNNELIMQSYSNGYISCKGFVKYEGNEKMI